jgi:hypothetical protein
MRITDPKKRMAICRACPFMLPKVEVCKKCGCVLAMKARLKWFNCPMGKWEEKKEN